MGMFIAVDSYFGTLVSEEKAHRHRKNRCVGKLKEGGCMIAID